MEEDFLNSFTEFHQSIFIRPTLGNSNGFQTFVVTKPTQEEVNRLTRAQTKVAGSSSQTDSEIKKSFTKKIIEWIKG